VIHFVLLSHARSGSTLLVRSLAEHTNVRMFGELFNEDEGERARVYSQIRRCVIARRRGIKPSMYYRQGEDGAEFLRERVFYRRAYEEIIKSVGFKLFYRQARDTPAAKGAWQYLLDNKQIHVIHLARFNLLETYLSLRIAMMTNEWARLKGRAHSGSKEVPALSFDPEECASFFNEITAYREWVRSSWADHPMLELSYEDNLGKGYDSTMREVEDFLRVGHRPAEKRLEKQARRHPREQLSNYDELKEYFRYTIHEQYFE
jgi:LPS sulfotransferase NodH